MQLLGQVSGERWILLVTSRLRLLAWVEGDHISGPVGNLLRFARTASALGDPELPEIELLFATYRRDERADAFIRAIEKHGNEVWTISERRRFDLSVVRQLEDLTNRLKPDLVQTHAVKSHFLARLSNLAAKTPWVAFHHGYTTTDLKMRAYNQLDRWSLRAATGVVTMNERFRRELVARGVRADRIVVQHNAVNVARFEAGGEKEAAALRRELDLPTDCRVILAVGRLSSEKGLATLIAALARLVPKASFADLCLVIVGEGPQRQTLEKMCCRLHVEDRVRFPGHRARVDPFYRLASALALPSHSEGSPNVLLEAMAAGVPIAATQIGGVLEIVEDRRSALLVPPRRPAALAAALEELLTDEKLANTLRDAARQRVASLYGPVDRTKALLRIYRDLVVQRRAGTADLQRPAPP